MTFEEARKVYIDGLKDQYSILTDEELVARIGKTTIRCGWVDFVDYLMRDGHVDENIAKDWGQII